MLVAWAPVPMTSITVQSRRKKLATIETLYPGAMIVDVTSKGSEPFVWFSSGGLETASDRIG